MKVSLNFLFETTPLQIFDVHLFSLVTQFDIYLLFTNNRKTSSIQFILISVPHQFFLIFLYLEFIVNSSNNIFIGLPPLVLLHLVLFFIWEFLAAHSNSFVIVSFLLSGGCLCRFYNVNLSWWRWCKLPLLCTK